MRLNVQSDYALRLLMHLAVNTDNLCTIADTATRYGISKNHLMKVAIRWIAPQADKQRYSGRRCCPPDGGGSCLGGMFSGWQGPMSDYARVQIKRRFTRRHGRVS